MMLNIRRLSTRQVEVTRWQQRYQPDRSATIPQAGERYFRLNLSSVTEKFRRCYRLKAGVVSTGLS